jgi:hypothetical protein
LREEEKLASAKLVVLSNPMGPVPMWYDVGSYVRYKGENGKSDTTQKL